MYKQELLLLNQTPDCYVVTNARRNALLKNNNIPSHDPYIPRANSIFYNCSSSDCVTLTLYSLTQLSSPDLNLKSCYPKPELTEYQCETVRYSYFKNIDKLLFLTNNINNKTFYLVDCLVYVDGGRVCHKKDENVDQLSHTKLIDTGTIVRPNETNVLSQDEFLCEEGDEGIINCDLNPFVPFQEGLKLKETVKVEGDILLKTGMYVVTLKKNCFDDWCGYSGVLKATRRQSSYRPPGGMVYRCFYAKKQQVCLPLYSSARSVYNDRGWVWACGTLAALDGYSAQQDSDQFHIQTDEDDERFFLYQTHNGQYRKERRLKDGSVVGSTGWVGADGYFRLQDYIADHEGYRIYKSKTVYVGQNRPIGESIRIAKTAPTDSGFGVTPAPTPAVHRSRGPPRVTSTTLAPYLPSSTQAPPYYPPEVSITPPPRTYSSPSTPNVYVSPNSIDSSTPKYDFRPTPITASEAAPSSSPYDFDSSNTNTVDDSYIASDSTPYKRYDIYNPNSYRHADAWRQRQQQPTVRIGDGYTPQFPGYDGVAFRRNGFRYYLPKQYHEEETGAANDRTGSFGYVDPFGIRRVIYYNTSPGEGFQIRKNNRYVGHDATPYDPRPVN